MSNLGELDDFRREWRQELKHEARGNETKQHGVSGNVSPTSAEQCSEKYVSESKHPLRNIDRAKRKKNTLQSFLIAETLLKGDDAKQYLTSPNSRPGCSSTSGADDTIMSPIKRLRTSHSGDRLSQGDSGRQAEPKPRFLDIFLQDLNEINEIPFFDTSLPREVAIKMFQYLDAVDLCRCSQVSVAWRSLAEDELLWCRICHQLGFEEQSVTADNDNWKDRVRKHVESERNLQLNWKNRTGRFRQLEYVSGGVLTAADTHGSTVVAGYTNGHVKLWDLDDTYERTFKPSTTALVLDEDSDSGTIPNYPSSVAVGDVYCAAGYPQGVVDIWKIEGDTAPLHSFQCRHPVSALCWSSSGTVLGTSHGGHVRVESFNQKTACFEKTDDVIFELNVQKLRFVSKGPQASKVNQPNLLVVAAGDQVKVHQPGSSPDHMTSLHHVMGSTVSCFDCDINHVAVGMTYYEMTETYKDKVKLYNLHTGEELLELRGHTWTVNCINLKDSPPGRLVTGSGDKKVRVFDLRLEEPVVALTGHAAGVSCVQMDDWKIVSGAQDGLVCVWDQRMTSKLWDMHNRHPVRHVDFRNQLLVTANIPQHGHHDVVEEVDSMTHRRYRGSLLAYDFSTTQETPGVPSICLSTYDEPESYNYNIRLAVPYDHV